MSEARNYFSEYGGARTNVAKLRFAVNEPLRERIQHFYNQAYVRSMGRGALFLYSEKGMRYVEEQRLVDYQGMEDISGLQEVDELQRGLRHRTNGQRGLAPTAEFKRLPEDEEGMLMRLGVVIDELTARVLKDTVFMDDNRVVTVNLRVPHVHLDRGTHLLEARDQLVDALQTGYPILAVESLELVSREQRH